MIMVSGGMENHHQCTSDQNSGASDTPIMTLTGEPVIQNLLDSKDESWDEIERS